MALPHKDNGVSRRDFIKVLGSASGVVGMPNLAESLADNFPPDARPQENKSATKQLGSRHIHLDFHTSPAIANVGKDFNASIFASTLVETSVNSITIFAKCHQGMSYYPTRIGTIHPQLKFDLLGQMIEACHKQKILTFAYISTMYDQLMWREHGEWRVIDEHGVERGHRGPAGPLRAELGKVCINSPYLDFLAAQADEVTRNYAVDGMFYDNYLYPDGGCCCSYCMRERDRLGLDSMNKLVRTEHCNDVLVRGMAKLAAVARNNRPTGSILFNGPLHFRDVNHIRTASRYSTHIEIESLPGGAWGYGFFDVAVRYLRNLGLETSGMTARFHRSWGDFGSLRSQAALDYECFRMLAQATKCAVGDHLHPYGALDGAVYERIGTTYRSVANKEPWCADAVAMTEIGVLTTANYIEAQDLIISSDLGATNLLSELHHQFDILDRDSDFARYKLIILPDFHRLDGDLLRKVTSYLAGDGKIILSNESGVNAQATAFALPELGLDYEGTWPHQDQYVEIVDEAMRSDFPDMVEVFYTKGQAVKAHAGTTVLGRAWKSFFDRNYEHFQVEQTPFSEPTDYAGVTQCGNTIYIAAPVFKMYAEYAYPFYQQLIRSCVQRLLPKPLISARAPSTAQITMTRQPQRWVVHVLNYIPQRRAPNVDVVQEASPLMDVEISARVEREPQRVYLAPQSVDLRYTFDSGYVNFEVPKVDGHQMIAVEG